MFEWISFFSIVHEKKNWRFLFSLIFLCKSLSLWLNFTVNTRKLAVLCHELKICCKFCLRFLLNMFHLSGSHYKCLVHSVNILCKTIISYCALQKKTSTNTFQLHDIYRYTVVYIPIHSHKHNATDAVSAASNSQFSRIDVQI